jgi:hypothetical protein
MVTLKENLIQVHNYVIDRIHTLCEDDIDDAYSLHCEFREWMNPDVKDIDVMSLEYIGDEDGGNI